MDWDETKQTALLDVSVRLLFEDLMETQVDCDVNYEGFVEDEDLAPRMFSGEFTFVQQIYAALSEIWASLIQSHLYCVIFDEQVHS